MDSNQQFQNQMPEDAAQLPSSGISYQEVQGRYLSQNGGSHMWSPCPSINISHSVVQMPHDHDAHFVPGEININVLSNATNSRTSFEESSLITDGNSSFSGMSYMPSNVSNSTESLASNCRRILGTPSREPYPAQQQTFQAGQSYPRGWVRRGEQLPNPTFTPPLMIPTPHATVSPLVRMKKPRLEIMPEDNLRACSLQQLSPSQVPMQLRSHDPVAAARLYQEQLMHNQRPKFVPSPQRNQMQCVPRNRMPGDAKKPMSNMAAIKGSQCYRRLMYYMYHQRKRPSDNNINYWRTFVEEYYSPAAKKRWCLSNYHNVDSHAYGVFSQAIPDSWNCDFCGSKTVKGFEATYEVLPRVSQMYFQSGVIDEILYVDLPVEGQLTSGFTVLWFEKAVQESIYKCFRVVHEGQLRIIFTQDLKIISWDFCIQRHEEFISRRLVAAQVNDLVDAAAKCQSNIEAKETEGLPAQDLLSKCNRVMAAGKNLATNLELPLVNDLGFSKHFVRHMQVCEVLNCMKDLMAVSQANNLSPRETLRRYHQEAVNAKLKKHMEDGAQMQQTPNAADTNYQMANFMAQTPNAAQTNCQMVNLMIQTPNAVDSNCQIANFTTQTPNAREQDMLVPASYYQKLLVEEQRMPSDKYHNQSSQNTPSSHPMSRLHSNSSAKSSLGPHSSLHDPTFAYQVNDLLARMRAEGTSGTGSRFGKGKRRLEYDPVEGPEVASFADQTKVCTVENEATSSYNALVGGMVDKGKGLNYSSSSNSSARIFADNCMVKREAVSDDDFTSPDPATKKS